ncbi:MAG: hypothetical protein GY761_09865 [Hyphomicrobiales bacterium]|nr:hypothetical protein [Hyphomicrobiales bacterium]
MRNSFGSIVTILILAVSALIAPRNINPSNSQTLVQFTDDFENAKFKLGQKGFYQIDLVGQGFTKFHIEACQNGVRYWFKSDHKGNINKQRKIGTCRPPQNAALLSKDRIRQILKSYGFERVKVEQIANINVAVACFGDDRFRVQVDQRGQVVNRRQIGNCRSAISTKDIRASLKRDGYNEIRFTNKRPPVYVVEACHSQRKYRFELNEFGNTLSRKSIGNCRNRLDPRNITQFLEKSGFTRVSVLNDRPPNYIVEVCEKRKRLELTLNQFGDITDRYGIGKCKQKISARQLIRNMRDQGYLRINIKRETNRGYLAQACLSGQLYRIGYDHYGKLQDERQMGPCPSWSIKQVKDQLEKRKFRNTELYVEGCKRGKRIRFKLNEFGDRSDRQVVGNCN